MATRNAHAANAHVSHSAHTKAHSNGNSNGHGTGNGTTAKVAPKAPKGSLRAVGGSGAEMTYSGSVDADSFYLQSPPRARTLSPRATSSISKQLARRIDRIKGHGPPDGGHGKGHGAGYGRGPPSVASSVTSRDPSPRPASEGGGGGRYSPTLSPRTGYAGAGSPRLTASERRKAAEAKHAERLKAVRMKKVRR